MLDGFGSLRDWLTNLVAIVMFASFVELLLPDSDMGRHVKMVLGFTVVLFIIKPLVAVDVPKLLAGSTLERLGVLSDMTKDTAEYSTQQVLARGEELAQSSARVLQGEQLDRAAGQLEATLELLGGVSQARVDIHAGPDGAIEGAAVSAAFQGREGAATRSRIQRYVAMALRVEPGLVEVHGKGVQ